MVNYVQEGEVLTLVAPYDVVSGAGFQVGSIFAVANNDALSGADVEGSTCGVFTLAKDSSTVVKNLPAYWDNSAKKVTITDAGNKRIGVFLADAATGAATVNVLVQCAAYPRFFVSAEATGTGSAQNVAHGLGVIPSAVLIAPTDLTPSTVGSYSVVEGTHTTSNVVVTVTASKKFKVAAFVF